MSKQKHNSDPDTPPRLGQSYIPQRYPWQVMPLSRFFWGLFLHPQRENWLLVGLFFGCIATFFALAVAVGIIQANGWLGVWSLSAVAVLAGLLALDYLLLRLRGRTERQR